MNRIALTAAVLVLVLTPGAAANVRYAAPSGSGTACSQASPCSLNTAVGAAAASDEIVVGAGSHALSATLAPAVPLVIHGTPGAARPRISGPPGSPAIESSATLQITDLTLESTNADPNATAALYGDNSSADRVEILALNTTGGSTAFRPGSGFVLRDSLLRASGPTGASALFFQAVAAGTKVTLRNVTAIASAPTNSYALGIFGTALGQNTSIEGTNVIADGGVDASAAAAPGITAAISLFNSNFDTSSGTVTGSGNQTPPPVFVNTAGGDFRAALGSPTIDAGLTDPANGPLDLDGNPRTVNGATDIGAYELQPAGSSPQDKSPPKTTIGALRLRGRIVSARLSCPSGESRCNWVYSLRSRKRVATKVKRGLKRKVVSLGKGTASAAGGKRVTIKIRLSKKNVRLIKRLKRLPVKLTVVATDSAGNKATRTKNGTLKAARKKAKRRNG